MENRFATWTAALLVAGTSIGAGMLALPVVTGAAGFLPAMVVNTLCWLFMLCTGLLFLETTLRMEKGTHLLSMARRFLGPIGGAVGGLFFLFLYYCLLVAYIAGGAPLLLKAFTRHEDVLLGYPLFTLIFGLVVLFGARFLNKINWVLMISLIFSYFLLIGLGTAEINAELLERKDWGLTMMAAPILFSAYGYHNIIPSITIHLKQNARQLRWAIFIGTAIPFVVYSLWQFMIIGSIPELFIREASDVGMPATELLQRISTNRWSVYLGAYFGFFALVTSFLGVSLSMVDFYADSLKVRRQGLNRLLLCVMVFVPPAFFASLYPGAFIKALEFAGGFGEAVLNGLIPIFMAWAARYRRGMKEDQQLGGGKPLLIVLTLFTVWIMWLEAQQLMA